MIVYRARWVLPITSAPIEHGAVAVSDDGRIAFAGAAHDAPAGESRDLGACALLPGLVNAHTHLELTAMRGFLEHLPFVQWIRTLTRARRDVLSEADLLDAARLGIIDGLGAGITTYADTCQSGVVLEALCELGVRGIMYQEVFGPDPAQKEESLRALAEKVAAYRLKTTELVAVGVSPHAPYTVSTVLFQAVAELARREGLPSAIHIAEGEEEVRFVLAADGPWAESHRDRGIATHAHGVSPIAYLSRNGVLDAMPLLIHCVFVDTNDIATIAAAGCAVAHCPVSNATLGHGKAPLVALLAANVPVGLGSDSMASNERMNLFDEARAACHAQQGDTLDAPTMLQLATLGGARALRLEARIGSLQVGKDADLAAFPIDALRNPAEALIRGGAPATLVTVKGRELVRDGRVLADNPHLRARVADSAARLTRWRASQP